MRIETAVIGKTLREPSIEEEIKALSKQVDELIYAVQTLTEVIAEKN